MTGTGRYLNVLFAGCLIILIAATILFLAFQDRVISFDEAGLENPPYMLLHSGTMTYPIHGHFDDMVVHPPTHYLAIALFMEFGLNLFHAAAVMPVLFFIAGGLLLLTSRMAFPIKFGLLFGMYLGAVVWTSTQTVRPDVSLAVAWIAGLIGLEAGRLADWDWKRLLIGSAFLGYAAVVHYPGAFCWTGILVYIVWAWRDLPPPQALRRIGVMIAGLGLTGLPYLVFFVLPFRHEIAAVVNQHQGEGGLLSAYRHHIEAYATWSSQRAAHVSTQPLLQTLLRPLWSLRLPAAFIGPPLLFAFRSTRGLALAALPQVLFIVLGARHKVGFSGYFAPEMMLYLAAVIGIILAGMFFLAQRIPGRIGGAILMLCSLVGLTALTLHEKPTVAGYHVRFAPGLNDLDLGRAAARQIAGQNAFIGTTSLGVWYTGGATHFYNVSPELLYGPTLAINPKDYFAWFDALVVDQLESWVTWNKERVNLTSLYLSGDLQLKGFWLAERHANTESELSWMMFASQPGPVRGYAMRDDRMYRFEQTPDGDSVFASLVCPATDLIASGRPRDAYGTLFLPSQTNADPREAGSSMPLIRMLLVSKDHFQHDVVPAAAHCKVRDQITGKVTLADSGAMLAQLKATDHTIHFYRSFPTALAGANRLNAGNTTRIPDAIDLHGIGAANPQSRVLWRGTSVDVRTAPTRWWDAAAIPIRHTQSVAGGFIHVRGRMLAGVVGISVRGRDPNSILGSEAIWGNNDGINDLYIPITSFDGSERLVIRNQRPDAESEVLIEDASVVVLKPHK